MDASPQLGDTKLFSAGGVTYTVDDAVASALRRDALDDAINETLALANADREIDDDVLQASSEKFRYDHSLITAGETEAWLAERGMTTDDFGIWLYQRLAADPAMHPGDLDVPDDFADLLRIHLWLSGRMDDLSDALRRRVAAGLESSTTDADGWEAAYERLAATALTDDARKRKLETMALSLARVEIDSLALESEPAAREAVLCVHNDGVSLAELALETGYHDEKNVFWMDELEDKLAHRVMSAAEGDVIGPRERNGRFEVLQIVRKIKPALTDAMVLRRIDDAILDEYFDDLCARHIGK